jgi:hypothetical protein
VITSKSTQVGEVQAKIVCQNGDYSSTRDISLCMIGLVLKV